MSTNQPSYTTNQPVSMTTVIANGSPVVGASVTFTITKPNGAVITAKVTTGSDGKVVYTLRLKKSDPLGTYQVRAYASLNGASGTAGTSFAVR